MKKEEMETLTSGMQTKLGNETSALINDDLATIILENERMNNEITKRDKEISKLNQDKEKLILTNNQLFQQVAMGKENDLADSFSKEEPKKEPFSLKNVFDEKGNFIN